MLPGSRVLAISTPLRSMVRACRKYDWARPWPNTSATNQYRLSTRVGRIILDEIDTQARNFGEKGDLFKFGRPNKIVYDYTEKGAMKSVEDSLKRLGVDRLDFVWIHDVAPDFHGDEWLRSSKRPARELAAPWTGCVSKVLSKPGGWARIASSLVSWRSI